LEKSTERSVERTLNILEELALWPNGISLSELARCVELPKATAHRLLNTLISRDYVMKEAENGKYRLTMRLFEIGSYGGGGRHILSAALPHLEALARETNETISLAIPDDTEMVYLFRGASYNMGVRMPDCVGVRNPLYACATGKSILSALPLEERKAIWKRMKITRRTVHTKMTFEEFEPEVEWIHQHGYAFDNEEGDIGVRGIAVAIMNYAGSPIASVGISALVGRMDDDKIAQWAPKLIAVGKNIAASL
jgi:DNA-binding IclR family transcriptional regulator